MSVSRQLAQRLLPSAAETFSRLARERRSQLWSNADLQFRLQKHPKAEEESSGRAQVAKPDISTVELFSQALGRRIPLQITSQMLREVESKGGLDDFLMNTPDQLLRSDAVSQLKWRITSIVQRNRMAANSVAAMRRADAAAAAAYLQ